jgi:uncharacterized protein (DUF58 family)
MPSLTKTGLIFLGLCVMLYLGALQSETGLLYFLLGILGACFLLNAAGARRSARGLELELPHSVSAYEGQRLGEGWGIRNTTAGALGMASVWGPFGRLFSVGAIEPAGHSARTPEIVLPRRGVYPFSSLRLESTYPFGLLSWSRPLEIAGEIVVFPRPYPCEPPEAAGHEPMVGGHYTGGKHSRSGLHFTGVRPLQPSDPPKLIHWKSSSKGRGLQVKELEEELSGRVALVLDASTGGVVLDSAARAAASLLYSALDCGHHVELVDLSRLERVLVPPFSDGAPALDALARLEPDRTSLTRERLELAVGSVSAKASIVLVLTRLVPELDAWLHAPALARRRLSVLLPAAVLGGDEPSGVRVRRYHPQGIEARRALR